MRLLPFIILGIAALGGVYTASYISASTSLSYKLVVASFAPWAPALVVENRGLVRACLTGLHATLYLDRVKYAVVSIDETICVDPGSNATILLSAYERPLWSPARLLDLLQSLYGEMRDLKLVVRLRGVVDVKPDLPGAQPLQESIEAETLIDYRVLVKSVGKAVDVIVEKAVGMSDQGREAAKTLKERMSRAMNEVQEILTRSLSEANSLLRETRDKAREVAKILESKAGEAKEAAEKIIEDTSKRIGRVTERLEEGLKIRVNTTLPKIRVNASAVEDLVEKLKEQLNEINQRIQELTEKLREGLDINATKTNG